MDVTATLLPAGVADHFSYTMQVPKRTPYLLSLSPRRCVHAEWDNEKGVWINHCENRRKPDLPNGFLCVQHQAALFPYKKDHEVPPFKKRIPFKAEVDAEEIYAADKAAIEARPSIHVRLFKRERGQ